MRESYTVFWMYDFLIKGIHLNGFLNRQTTGILGPYFVENGYENLFTLNYVRYSEKVLHHFWASENLPCKKPPLRTQWFQQDGAYCEGHDSFVSSKYCEQRNFSWNRLLYRFHSPDLTSYDANIYGMLKEVTYEGTRRQPFMNYVERSWHA